MAAPRTHRQKEIRRHLWIYGAITPYDVIAVFPIYWMAITAFKQDPDLYRMDQFPLWFHLAPTWKHFRDRKSTRLNSSHVEISYAVFCLKKKKQHAPHFPRAHKGNQDKKYHIVRRRL